MSFPDRVGESPGPPAPLAPASARRSANAQSTASCVGNWIAPASGPGLTSVGRQCRTPGVAYAAQGTGMTRDRPEWSRN